MRKFLTTAVILASAIPLLSLHAQGFTAQELDRMSKERLDHGDFRSFAAPPAPPKTTSPIVLHQPRGMWSCLGIDEDTPILSTPSPSAATIGRSGDHIAAGNDAGGYTSVLLHEGTVGYVPKSTVHPYRNQFNPSATCSVQGLRPNGVVQYSVR